MGNYGDRDTNCGCRGTTALQTMGQFHPVAVGLSYFCKRKNKLPK